MVEMKFLMIHEQTHQQLYWVKPKGLEIQRQIEKLLWNFGHDQTNLHWQHLLEQQVRMPQQSW